MTIDNTSSNKKETALGIITAFLIVILLCHSQNVSEGIYSGAQFAARCLIPTLFPFFIISDMIFAYGLPFAGRLKRRGDYVIMIGVICGFPHGARCATRLFEDGKIGSKEYERLLILSNCPSLAFVVSGIGSGMMGSAVLGLILYISLVFSVIVLSLFNRSTLDKRAVAEGAVSVEFNLTDSIKRAGISSITVASFVIFFYGVCALTTEFISDGFISLIISAVLEIATGAKKVASSDAINTAQKMLLLGFIIGFSSISTFMQNLAFVSGGVKKGRLFGFKILQGILCALFALTLTLIYKKWLS